MLKKDGWKTLQVQCKAPDDKQSRQWVVPEDWEWEDILDFKLSDDDMVEIAKLNKDVRYYNRTDEALAGFAAWQPMYEKE
ncbi:MAG: hypothetical protein LUD18_09970 [Lachnospiraceae bacterium]|nr:hypothetical protein [Lachnospiraceae bacterium]